MIRHVLKDGTELKDITGYVVKPKDAEPVYDLLLNINRNRPKMEPKEKARQ